MSAGARRATGLILATLCLAGPAAAQPTPPAKPCTVAVESRMGGFIESIPAKGAAASQVIWQPIATAPGVVLLVIYGEGALAHMDEPGGVLIRFHTPGDRTDSLSVRVTARNGRAWRFDGAAIVTDPGGQAHLAIGLDWPYGRGVLAAIAEGQSLTISVEQDGQVLSSSGFGLSNIDARDTLLAQARAKVQAADPATCAAAPPAG